MKKITLLLVFLIACASAGYAQCFNTSQYPSSTIVSNNLGLVQTIATNNYTTEYAKISNVIVGENYIFTCTLGTTEKYITVTDLENNVIASGDSPLTVEDITSADIRVHFTEDAACAGQNVSHLTTIQAILTCMPPVNLSVGGITTTAADFAWEPAGSETAWEVIVVAAGDPAPTADTEGIAVTANPAYTDLTLTAASNYQFYVRANCGSEFSPWNGPLSFASGCDPIGLFDENFDNTNYGALPTCWTEVIGEGASQYAYVQAVDYNYVSASRSVELYNSDSASGSNIILASPSLSTLANGTHRLKFYARAYGNASIQVGTLDSATADGTFTSLEDVDITGTYAEYAVDFTGYMGTDTFVAIRHNSGTYVSIFLDNIRWEVAPLCPDVTVITAPSTTVNSATISWNPGGDETEWDLVYGATSVTDPTTLTPITPAPTGTPEATITGLTDNTTYNVWVRSVCGVNDGAWIGPVAFTTACLPTGLFNENFDTTAYGALPGCWSEILNNGASQYAYVQAVDYNYVTASRSVQLYNSDSATSSNIILASPNLSTLSSGTHRLKFYARSYGNASIEVGTLDSNTASATFSSLEAVAITGTYAEYAVDFTGYDGTDTYIGIRHNSGTYTSIFLDDIRWEIAPLCADVTGVTVPAATVDSATINWTPGGDETEWDVVYGDASVTDPTTLTPITPAPTGNAEATLTGLTDNTTYKVWVRSVCGVNDGAWIGPVSFTTACLPTALFDEDFDDTAYGNLPGCWSEILNNGASQYAYVQVVDYNYVSASKSVQLYNSDSAASSNIILASPNLSTLGLGTHRLKFYARSYGNASIEVGTLDSATASANFSSLEVVDITGTYTEYVVDFTGYTGTDTYIGIRHNSGMYTSIFLDDIRWEVAPLCADIVDLTASEITTVTASLSWSAGGSESNWQIAYGDASVTDPTTLTPSDVLSETNFNLLGLTENTTYSVWCRSVCGAPNGNGAWIGPIYFTTQCLATTVPFTQDFESATTPSLPSCSSSENLSNGNNWITNTVNSYGFNSKVLQYSYTCSSAADAWYYTQGISLNAGTEYSISYKYGNSSNGNWTENLKIMFGLNPGVDDMTVEIADHQEISLAGSTENEVFFTVETTGVYYFGFNVYSESCQDYLYVDNISIQTSLGAGQFNASEFKFYPNPVKDVLNLSYAQNISNVAVFNLLGQKVIENTINANTAQVDMSALSSGTYVVKVTSDNQTKTIKVIKE